MSKKEERSLFKSWDNVYRQIRKEKISKGISKISPSDTRDLYKTNVITQVTKSHKYSKIFEFKSY